jgi:predicted metal-binding membrane protein
MVAAVTFGRAIFQEISRVLLESTDPLACNAIFLSAAAVLTVHAGRCGSFSIVGFVRASQLAEELVEHHDAVIVGAYLLVGGIFRFTFSQAIQV